MRTKLDIINDQKNYYPAASIKQNVQNTQFFPKKTKTLINRDPDDTSIQIYFTITRSGVTKLTTLGEKNGESSQIK